MTYPLSSTTTKDEQDYYEKGRRKVFIPRNNLRSILSSTENFHLRCAAAMLSTTECMNTLASISIKSEYSDELRALFFFINEQLSLRGIAPAWRHIKKASYRKNKKMTESEERYSCDCQIVDMLWLYSEHTVQPVNDWDGLYRNFFDQDEFDYSKADVIANASLTSDRKASDLKLPDLIQYELCTIRSDKVRKRVQRALQASRAVELDILNAADRNPHKGKKVSEQASTWSQIWCCRELVGNSAEKISGAYEKMTGVKLSRSAIVKKLKKIDATLSEVKSPHRK